MWASFCAHRFSAIRVYPRVSASHRCSFWEASIRVPSSPQSPSWRLLWWGGCGYFLAGRYDSPLISYEHPLPTTSEPRYQAKAESNIIYESAFETNFLNLVCPLACFSSRLIIEMCTCVPSLFVRFLRSTAFSIRNHASPSMGLAP